MRKKTNKVMLYKKGSMAKIHGVMCDYTIIDKSQIKDYLDNGWSKTPKETVLVDTQPTEEKTKKPGRPKTKVDTQPTEETTEG